MNWFSQDTPAILFGIRTAIKTVLAALFLGSLLLTMWGFFRFKFSKDPAVKTKAKSYIERGIIGAVVMVTTWGIVTILMNILGIPSDLP